MKNEKKRILIIDDDKYFVQSVKDLLTSEGYSVIHAYNGSEGLDMAKGEHPDLIILDVMMAHDTEGFEVSREVDKNPELKNTKIIMITGITKEMNLPFKFEPDKAWLPVDEIMEKPVAPDDLLKAIRSKIG